jgi:hypothetical protein
MSVEGVLLHQLFESDMHAVTPIVTRDGGHVDAFE